MKHVNIFATFALARDLQSLRFGLEDGACTVLDAAQAGIGMRIAMGRFLRRECLPLDGDAEAEIAKAGQALWSALSGLAETEKLARYPEAKVHAMDKAVVVEAIDRFENAIYLSAGALALYFVPQRLGYSTPSLLDSPGRLFGDLGTDVMALAGRDIEEATRCFAFERPTAAAFHMIRACEHVLTRYAKACRAVLPERATWANTITALCSAVRDVPPGLTRQLHSLRQYDRNEYAHPGNFATMDEAAAILEDAKRAILGMVRDMKKRVDGGGE